MGPPDDNHPAQSGPATHPAAALRQGEVALVERALPFVDEVARKLERRLGGAVPIDDLRSAGHFALTDLVRRFDPERAPFAAYLRQRLRWAMLDTIRKETHGRALFGRTTATAASQLVSDHRSGTADPQAAPPSEMSHKERLRAALRDHAAAVGISLIAAHGGDIARAPSSANPETAIVRRSAANELREAVMNLDSERHRMIILRYYFEGAALVEIAGELGVSKGWASRLHAEAIRLLEKQLRNKGLAGPR